MGVYFPSIDFPSGCQLCVFAPIITTPLDDGKVIKEQFCLVTRELIQSAIVDSPDSFPDDWWEDKHIDCPGMKAWQNEEGDEHEKEEV